MVVMARSPIDPIGNRHERTGTPSICTVQAPHWAMPQPNLVPVSPTISRSAHSSGISGGASISLASPLIRRLTIRHLRKATRRHSPSLATTIKLERRSVQKPLHFVEQAARRQDGNRRFHRLRCLRLWCFEAARRLYWKAEAAQQSREGNPPVRSRLAHYALSIFCALGGLVALPAASAVHAQTADAEPVQHEFIIRNFKTESGVVLPEAHIVYG